MVEPSIGLVQVHLSEESVYATWPLKDLNCGLPRVSHEQGLRTPQVGATQEKKRKKIT